MCTNNELEIMGDADFLAFAKAGPSKALKLGGWVKCLALVDLARNTV